MVNFRLRIEKEGESFDFSYIGIILTIGQTVGQLILLDEEISSVHCSLIIQPESYNIIDHNSKFGSFLNGRMVGQNPIQVGDILKLGKYTIEILELNGMNHFTNVFNDPKLEEIYQWIIKSYSRHLSTL